NCARPRVWISTSTRSRRLAPSRSRSSKASRPWHCRDIRSVPRWGSVRCWYGAMPNRFLCCTVGDRNGKFVRVPSPMLSSPLLRLRRSRPSTTCLPKPRGFPGCETSSSTRSKNIFQRPNSKAPATQLIGSQRTFTSVLLGQRGTRYYLGWTWQGSNHQRVRHVMREYHDPRTLFWLPAKTKQQPVPPSDLVWDTQRRKKISTR